MSVVTTTFTLMTNPSQPLSVLSTDSSGQSLGLSLPQGSLVTETMDAPWHEPLLWVADEPARSGTWAEHLPTGSAAGLRPVLLQDEPGAERWWEDGLDPGLMSDPGAHDAEEVLKALWKSAVSETDEDEDPDEEEDEEEDRGETLAPFSGSWPGLAPAGSAAADRDAAAALVADGLIAHRLPSPRLALVPVGRSADLPAAIGWTGPVNHENDVARLCAVLRSWEDRFGIRVIALSPARLDLSVATPPQTLAEALPIAAEHFAFCPDNVWQGYETLRLYAEEALVGNPYWTFWWD